MADLRVDDPASGQPEEGGGARHLRKRRSSERAFWTELPFLVVIALVLAVLLKTFVVQAFYIPSSSMEPTLQIQDRVLVTKLAYLYREPRRGEIVVFREDADSVLGAPTETVLDRTLGAFASGLGFGQGSERDYIKRIIGLPGETLEMRGGVIYIDDAPIPEAASEDGGYLSRPDLNDFGPVTIGDGEYFMMGDNRPNSSDSRFGLGAIPREQILGRAFIKIWPVDSFGTLPIASYEE